MNKNGTFIFIFFNIFWIHTALATVVPNSLFTDHMVLQQGVIVPVWGSANSGEKVTITFNGQKITTQAVNGKWLFKLKPLKAGGPFLMKISGENEVFINDVLIGEVWLCSGQSNMERQLGPRPPQPPLKDWEKERDGADYPQIREYYVPLKYSLLPKEDIGSHWEVCSPATVKEFSAVGYYFAKHLYKTLNVPVGIIFSAYGGTPAEYWTSRAVLENVPELLPIVQNYDKAVKEYPAKLDVYQKDELKLLEKYQADTTQARLDKKSLPRKPSPPADPTKGMVPGCLYNAMIAPLIPYPIKGVAWYQGEANNTRARQYQTLLPAMIAGWRNDWHLGDLPFLIVQIAPFRDMKPEIREAQLLITQNTKSTALIVTTDLSDGSNIHPPDKQPVGERLTLAARAIAYNEKIEYSGPIYQSMKVEGEHIVLSFRHIGTGLIAKDGDLAGFTIAGIDKKFIPARAEIKGNNVIVQSEGVVRPVAVRYGWSNIPVVNLFNKNGLPASPFRTDLE